VTTSNGTLISIRPKVAAISVLSLTFADETMKLQFLLALLIGAMVGLALSEVLLETLVRSPTLMKLGRIRHRPNFRRLNRNDG